MTRRLTLALPLIVAAMVALTGCGSPGVALERYSGVPSWFKPTSPLDEGPAAMLDGDGNLTLVTYGSSSCPATVTGIEAQDADTVALSLDAGSAGVCTADMAPTTHVIRVPDAASARPLTVHVTYTGTPWEYTISAE